MEVKRPKYITLRHQKLAVDALLSTMEDCSLEVLLRRVLKVGQKFSYIYDYGSSTYINLKVVGEREGIEQENEDSILLLAQNSAPGFTCIKCGKPATVVEIDVFAENAADNAYCDECAEEFVEEGRWIPIVNSPRVGVL